MLPAPSVACTAAATRPIAPIAGPSKSNFTFVRRTVAIATTATPIAAMSRTGTKSVAIPAAAAPAASTQKVPRNNHPYPALISCLRVVNHRNKSPPVAH